MQILVITSKVYNWHIARYADSVTFAVQATANCAVKPYQYLESFVSYVRRAIGPD